MEPLDPICHTSGTGPLFTGHTICMAGQSPHRVCSTSTARSVWCRTQDPILNSLWPYHVHWPDDRFGQRNQPSQNARERQLSYTPATNARWVAPRGPTNIEEAARRVQHSQIPSQRKRAPPCNCPQPCCSRPDNDCVLLLSLNRGIHGQGNTQQNKTHCCNSKWRMLHSSKKTNTDASCAYHGMHPLLTYCQQMGPH